MLDIRNLELGVRFIYEMFRCAVKDVNSYKDTDTQAKPYP